MTPPIDNGRLDGYRNLVATHLKQIGREPGLVFWLFVFPVLMTLGLGTAFRGRASDVRSVAILSGTGAEKTLRTILGALPGATVEAHIVEPSAAARGLRSGRYDLLIEPTSAQGYRYVYDPGRPSSELTLHEIDDALQGAAGRQNPVPTSAAASREVGSRYIDFLIPGLMGMNLMSAGLWGLGFALVDMRQRKLLKRFLATPVRRSDFLLALASSRLILIVAEVALLLGLGTLVFQMRVAGSFVSLLLLSVLAASTFGGLGLLIASRAQSIETASGLANLVIVPMWIFSGVFFSYERFPAVLHPFIRLLPLTAANDAFRATILEGAPLISQTDRVLVLGAWALIFYLLALRWFRWS